MTEEKMKCSYCGAEIPPDALQCPVCNKRIEPEALQNRAPKRELDTRIQEALSSQFHIIEEVGRGGMAIVYKAIQKNLDRPVALKVLPPQFTHDQEFLQRFHREAQAAAKLNHPNIVTIYDEGILHDIHYIAMEYIEGEDLHHIIQQKGPLPLHLIQSWLIPIAEGLGYAHKMGIIHRDIKSANILIAANDRPVLTDFGIAHAAESRQLTQAGTILGTPEYMSPEQARGDTIDARSDIYSLGVVLYECLTGRLPFQADTVLGTIHKITHDPPTPPRGIRSDIPKKFENVVLRCLAKDPNQRYQNCGELAEALKQGDKLSDATRIKLFKSKNKASIAPASPRIPLVFKFMLAAIVLAILVVSGLLLQEKGFLNIATGGELSRSIMKDAAWKQLTDLEKQRINALLDEADQLYITDRLVEPIGNNAYELYKKVLRIHPSNQYAIKRLELIKRDFIREAQLILKQENNLEKANKLIDHALQYFPGDLLLVRAKTANKITYLEEKTHRLWSEQKFLPPAEPNVWANCKQILKLDPNNTVAQNYLKQIQIQQINRINKALERNEFDTAQRLIEETRHYFSDLPVLKTLEKKNKILQLQTALHQSLQYQHFFPPEQPNALEIFGQLKSLMPPGNERNNVEKMVYDQVIVRIQQFIRDSQWTQAYAAINEAKKYFPNNEQLNKLWSDVAPQYTAYMRKKNIQKYLNLAHWAINQHEWSKAFQYYKQVLKYDPRHSEARRAKEIIFKAVVRYGDELYARQKFWAAKNQYYYALGLKPNDMLIKIKLEKAKEKIR